LPAARGVASVGCRATKRLKRGNSKLLAMRRQIFSNLFFSYANWATSILTPVLLVPLFVRLLGHELYGQWLVILSLISYLGLANLGMSRTFANEFAIAAAREDSTEVEALISTGFIGYAGVAAAMLIVLVVMTRQIATHFLAHASGATIAALLIAASCTALSFPFGLHAMLLRGFKRVDQEQGIGVVSNLARVIAIAFALLAGLKILAVAIVQGVMQILTGIASYLLAVRMSPRARPRLSMFSLRLMRRLLIPSAGFFAIQVAQTINIGLDNLVIAAYRSPAEITQYSVAIRLVFLNAGLFGVMLDTLAPYVTADFTLQRSERLQTGFVVFLKLALMFGVSASVGLWLLGPGIIRIWGGPGVFPGKLTFGLQIAFFMTSILGNPAYIVLTATMKHYGLTAVAIVECIINLALSIWLVQRWGIAGVIAGSVFAHLLTNAWYMQYGAIQVLDIPFLRIANEIGPAALLSAATLAVVYALTPLKAAPLAPGMALISTIVADGAFVCAFVLIAFNAGERGFVWAAAAQFIQSRNQSPEGFAG
jgi:O-antigen/teichoic acid export membrane protein